jgi:hypothetical protein
VAGRPQPDDLDALVRLRLNEHTLHSWDVAVALRPEATLDPEGVSLAPADGDGGGGEPDLALPAEALIRPVYGRLDPDHTPGGVVALDGVLDLLRRTFPGL